MKKLLPLILIMGCKSGGGGTLSVSDPDPVVDPVIEITEDTELSQILCAKMEQYECDDRIYEIGGYKTIRCAQNDSIDFVADGDLDALERVQEVAAGIQTDLDAAGISYSTNYTYGDTEREDSIYDTKLLQSDDSKDIHLAIDWSNETYVSSDGSGPLSSQGLYLQIENEDLLIHLESCFE